MKYTDLLSLFRSREHPLIGQSPYSASKIAADQMAIAYERSFNLPVCVLRPFNTYGPRQSARAIIPTIITQILQVKESLELGSLTPTRDFNYVQDTVNGFLSVLGKPKAIGEVINLGSNFEISIEETVVLIKRIMDSDIEVVTSPHRVRPQRAKLIDFLRQMKKRKGYLVGRLTTLERPAFPRGIQNTVDWFKSIENHRHYRDKGYVI